MNLRKAINDLRAMLPPPPRLFRLPFGVFRTPQEVHEHPDASKYIMERREEVFTEYEALQQHEE